MEDLRKAVQEKFAALEAENARLRKGLELSAKLVRGFTKDAPDSYVVIDLRANIGGEKFGPVFTLGDFRDAIKALDNS